MSPKQSVLLESEFDVQTAILRMLGCLPNVFLWRQNTGKAHSEDGKRWVQFAVPGCADILGCASGHFFAIETKRPKGGRQETDQKRFQCAVERSGGLYMLVRDPQVVSIEFRRRGWMP